MKIGDGTVFDMEELYGRMLVVSQQRHIDLRRVFSFEVAPHPLSLFDEFLSVELIGDDEFMFGHEEADVNMVNYTLMMSTEHGCRQIQIVSDDTDVLVLLVHFYWKLRPFAAITVKQFDEKTIDTTTMTDRGSVSYPFGKGKVSSLKVIIDSDDLEIEVFGESNVIGCHAHGVSHVRSWQHVTLL